MAGIRFKKWNNKVVKTDVEKLYDNMLLMLTCWKVRYDSMENVSWILDKVERQMKYELECIKEEAE